MTEHRPPPEGSPPEGSASECPASERLDDVAPALRCVTLPEIPSVYALLHPEDGLRAWVFELPGGDAVLVFCGEDGVDRAFWPVITDLEQVLSFWVSLEEAELVLVTT